jgi:hypothetical protein
MQIALMTSSLALVAYPNLKNNYPVPVDLIHTTSVRQRELPVSD